MNSMKKSAANPEIDEIMNEIQSLQKDMSSAVQQTRETQGVKRAVSTAVKATVKAVTNPVRATAAAITNATHAVPEPVNAGTATNEPGLDDFQSPPDEGPSLEETLGSMKPEEPTHDSLLADETPKSPVMSDAEAEEIADVVEAALSESDLEEISKYESETEEPLMNDHDDTLDNTVSETLHDLDHETGTGEDGSLTLQMTGNMNLKLKYEMDGQMVTIAFVNQQLRVTLADGTEFRVPLNRTGRGLKAA